MSEAWRAALGLTGKEGVVREGEMCPPLVRSAPDPLLLRPAGLPAPCHEREAVGLPETGVCRGSHLSLASSVVRLTQSSEEHQTQRRDFQMPLSTGQSPSPGMLCLLGLTLVHQGPSSSPCRRPEVPTARPGSVTSL